MANHFKFNNVSLCNQVYLPPNWIQIIINFVNCLNCLEEQCDCSEEKMTRWGTLWFRMSQYYNSIEISKFYYWRNSHPDQSTTSAHAIIRILWFTLVCKDTVNQSEHGKTQVKAIKDQSSSSHNKSVKFLKTYLQQMWKLWAQERLLS